MTAAATATVMPLPVTGKKITLPSGSQLMFFPEDHSYWRVNKDGARGRRLAGVTTVCKTLDHDPSRLLGWAARTQLIGVAELARREREWDGWLDSQETIQRALVQHKLTFEDVRDAAGSRGNTIHERVFEALAVGVDPTGLIDLDMLTLDERMALEGALAFWRDFRPKPILVEQVVYSERLGVAGRLDFFGSIKGRSGHGVIDWKTGRFLGAAAHAQVGGGYPLLLEESGWPAPDWSVMVQVADGGYSLVEAQGTPEHFETAVRCYRAAGEINSAAAKARKQKELAA